MQPSLGRILGPERHSEARGARLASETPSFGNYVQICSGQSAGEPGRRKDCCRPSERRYDADLANLEIQSDWIKSVPCPPRNGPTQNLAGMINDASGYGQTRLCTTASTSRRPDRGPTPLARTAADLIMIYGTTRIERNQRLRVQHRSQVFVVVDTGGGYVQCGPAVIASSDLSRGSVRRELAGISAHPDANSRSNAARGWFVRSGAGSELLENLSRGQVQ